MMMLSNQHNFREPQSHSTEHELGAVHDTVTQQVHAHAIDAMIMDMS